MHKNRDGQKNGSKKWRAFAFCYILASCALWHLLYNRQASRIVKMATSQSMSAKISPIGRRERLSAHENGEIWHGMGIGEPTNKIIGARRLGNRRRTGLYRSCVAGGVTRLMKWRAVSIKP